MLKHWLRLATTVKKVENMDLIHQTGNSNTVASPTVSVIIPTLNEEKNLEHVIPNIPDWVKEIIIVDGHSKDDTVEVAKSLSNKVRIVLAKQRGKGTALREGFAAAQGDIIVMLDADGSMAGKEIGAFVAMLSNGADFVKGSRFLQGAGTDDMEFYRQWGNAFFTIMVNKLFKARYTDLCYGYSAFWKRCLPSLALDATGFEIETMMNIRALKAQLTVYEVPSFEAKRIHGQSNLRTIQDGWRVLRTIFKEWRIGNRYTHLTQDVNPNTKHVSINS